MRRYKKRCHHKLAKSLLTLELHHVIKACTASSKLFEFFDGDSLLLLLGRHLEVELLVAVVKLHHVRLAAGVEGVPYVPYDVRLFDLLLVLVCLVAAVKRVLRYLLFSHSEFS